MIKLYKDILELKTFIRAGGATAEGKGQFGKIHSEKQLLDYVYKFNKEKNKELNIIWINKGVELLDDNRVLAKAKVIITNGTEVMEEETCGIGEEKRSDISFSLGKALTYGKRLWLQKFLDLSSDDIDPENTVNKPAKTYTTPVVNKPARTYTKSKEVAQPKDKEELAFYPSGRPALDINKKQLTKKEYENARELYKKTKKKIWDMTKEELQ